MNSLPCVKTIQFTLIYDGDKFLVRLQCCVKIPPGYVHFPSLLRAQIRLECLCISLLEVDDPFEWAKIDVSDFPRWRLSSDMKVHPCGSQTVTPLE